MTITYNELMKEALALPPGSRAMLAEHLLESLDADAQEKVDAGWAEEVERRLVAVETGTVQAVDGRQVIHALRIRPSL